MRLAWSAAVCTYLLIVLGAVVRITGSGLGCGNHWPLCNGRLLPPLDDVGTVIEWSHRLVAALVTVLVVSLAADAVWLWRRSQFVRTPAASFVALGLLVVQILLGAITVKLDLPPWTVILHLATAMLLFATLLVIADGGVLTTSVSRGSLLVLCLAFITVLFGALTANLGAAVACSGFPLCNGQVWPPPQAGLLAQIQWVHRLLAYSLAIATAVWAIRMPGRGPRLVLGLVALQVALGAVTVLLGLPRGLQAAHLATGAAVWGGVVLAARQTKAPMVG